MPFYGYVRCVFFAYTYVMHKNMQIYQDVDYGLCVYWCMAMGMSVSIYRLSICLAIYLFSFFVYVCIQSCHSFFLYSLFPWFSLFLLPTHTYTYIYVQIGRVARQVDRQVGRQVGGYIGIQVVRQIDRDIDRSIDRWIEIDRQLDERSQIDGREMGTLVFTAGFVFNVSGLGFGSRFRLIGSRAQGLGRCALSNGAVECLKQVGGVGVSQIVSILQYNIT